MQELHQYISNSPKLVSEQPNMLTSAKICEYLEYHRIVQLNQILMIFHHFLWFFEPTEIDLKYKNALDSDCSIFEFQ